MKGKFGTAAQCAATAFRSCTWTPTCVSCAGYATCAWHSGCCYCDGCVYLCLSSIDGCSCCPGMYFINGYICNNNADAVLLTVPKYDSGCYYGVRECYICNCKCCWKYGYCSCGIDFNNMPLIQIEKNSCRCFRYISCCSSTSFYKCNLTYRQLGYMN